MGQVACSRRSRGSRRRRVLIHALYSPLILYIAIKRKEPKGSLLFFLCCSFMAELGMSPSLRMGDLRMRAVL